MVCLARTLIVASSATSNLYTRLLKEVVTFESMNENQGSILEIKERSTVFSNCRYLQPQEP